MIMYQSWRRVVFVHWPCPADTLAARIDPALSVDTFEGQGWLSLVVFEASLFGLPFREANLRTYVAHPDGRRGIWFFSLDCDRPLLVYGARLGLGLPYRTAELSFSHRGGHTYDGASHAMSLHLEMEAGHRMDTVPRDAFLTERYTQFMRHAGLLLRQDIRHEPWPLRTAEIVALRETVSRSAELPPPNGTLLAHYSDGVHVNIKAPRLAGSANDASR